MKKNMSITVGIPTYEAGNSLVATLHSLYKQTGFHRIRKIIVVVDGNTISDEINAKIKNPKLHIIFGPSRKGQPVRINDIFVAADSDLIVLTNDDVVLDKNAIEIIANTYFKTTADLISASVRPLQPQSLLEKILQVGHTIYRNSYLRWNNGDNYLSCNGRLLALSNRLYKKVHIPERLWNNDAFLYLFVKTHHFDYTHEEHAIAWYRMPNQLSEHIKQSSKFKQSCEENNNYFRSDISAYYAIPKGILLHNLLVSFISRPFLTLLYIVVSVVTQFSEVPLQSESGYWQTDVSTKHV